MRATVAELEGAYALVVVSEHDPERLILAREGCPVVVGLGVDENFVASDVAALLPVTRRFIFLEEGDVAEVRRESVRVIDRDGNTRRARGRARASCRPSPPSAASTSTTCSRRSTSSRARSPTRSRSASPTARLLEAAFGPAATEVFERTQNVHIVACGTSYHAASVARYFIEQICKIPCAVDIASEYRYRNPLVPANSLFVTISQSGETADTLAALRTAPSSPATCPRWRSATCRRARWCASRNW